MKKILTFFLLCLSFAVYSQDNEYIINTRTGKFDAVRSAKYIGDIVRDSMQNFTETDPIYLLDSSYLKTNIRNINAATDTAAEWTSRTIYVSMPTDQQTSGSDLNGDGSQLKPYATILKALSGIKPIKNGVITIQLDSGMFNYSLATKALHTEILAKSTNLYFNSPIVIQGQYVKEPYTFTLSSTSILFAYKVNGYSFNNTQLEERFVGNTTSPQYPIESLKNDTIFYPSSSATSNNIYRLNTSINFEGNSQIATFNSSPIGYFKYVKGTFLSGSNFYYLNSVFYHYCILKNSTSSYFHGSNCQIRNTKFDILYTGSTVSSALSPDNSIITFSVINNLGTRKSTTNGIGIKAYFQMSAGIISGFKNAFSQYNNLTWGSSLMPNQIGIKDATNAFDNSTNVSAVLSFNCPSLSLYNVDYLFNSANSSSAVQFQIQSLTGKYGSLFNPASLYKDIVNPTLGGFITGLNVYPEIEQKKVVSLANNSTDSLSIGDKSYNRSIELKYTITRGTNYRTGTLKILSTGTALLFDPGDYIETADVGVTFSGAYFSGNSNTIKLKWTTTDTGTPATIQYDAFRQNY